MDGTVAADHARTLFASLAVCLQLVSIPGCTCLRGEAHDANVMAARQLSLKGIDAQQSGKWQEAEALFADALRRNPADERAHSHFAQVMWQRGRQADAIDHLEESVRLSGGDPKLLVELGEKYLTVGNIDAAWECAVEAAEANRHLAGAWALRGDIYRSCRRWDDALENYHRALSEQPHFPAVQLAAAAVYREQNRPRRALATLNTLEVQLRPLAPPPELFYQQGLAYKALGRYSDAVASLTTATQQADPSAEALFHLGEAQLLSGNLASARLSVQAALVRAPNHAQCLALQDLINRQTQSMTAVMSR